MAINKLTAIFLYFNSKKHGGDYDDNRYNRHDGHNVYNRHDGHNRHDSHNRHQSHFVLLR